MKEKNTFYAGASKIDITPSKGTIIGVDFFSHYARFIHDTLFSRCLIMKKNELTFAFIMVDICIMPSDLMNYIKGEIFQTTGISKEHILLACTHTHGSGDVAGLLGGAVDIAYRNILPTLIVQSVKLALNELRPSKIASGSIVAKGHHLCRRYKMDSKYESINPVTKKIDQVKTNPFGAEDYILKPAAEVDEEVSFLALKDLNNSYIAILGNFSSHYAGELDVDTITADFYGVFETQLKAKIKWSDNFVGILSYGTGADVNTWDFSNAGNHNHAEFSRTNAIGKDLADKVIAALHNLAWMEDANLKILYKEISLPVRKPNKFELHSAEKLLAENRFENLEIDAHGMNMIYAREQLLLKNYPEKHKATLQIVQVGDQIFGASGAELFSETGLWLKKQIPKANYFTVCLANSYDGYVPPELEMDKGGYETWRARSSFLGKKAESQIKYGLLNLVRKL